MKRFAKIAFCITAIIIISILFCLTYGFAEEAVMEEEISWTVTEYKQEWSEDFLWEALLRYSNNEKIIAGVMGYFYRESFMRSDAIAGWGVRNVQLGCDTSKEFTELIDAGLADGSTRDLFIEYAHLRYGGYGLGQWSSPYYVGALYDFAQKWGTSIGDAEMQCAFMIWSLEHQTPELWEDLYTYTNIITIGRKIGRLYDGTGPDGAETIAAYAQEYYKKYGTKNIRPIFFYYLNLFAPAIKQ